MPAIARLETQGIDAYNDADKIVTNARLETQAIHAYNDAHHYRAENPLAHLHEDEAPVETGKLKSSNE